MRCGIGQGLAATLCLLPPFWSAAGAQDADQGRDYLLGPVDGERFALFWDFFYEWQGPEGSSITWSADGSGCGIILTAMYNPLTETWGIGGDGAIPVTVTTVTAEGSMAGAGSATVDAGGSYANGLVRLTVLETTGGAYTITVDGYSMAASTPENLNTFEIVFNWEDVTGGLGDQLTVETENGFVTARMELFDARGPAAR